MKRNINSIPFIFLFLYTTCIPKTTANPLSHHLKTYVIRTTPSTNTEDSHITDLRYKGRSDSRADKPDVFPEFDVFDEEQRQTPRTGEEIATDIVGRAISGILRRRSARQMQEPWSHLVNQSTAFPVDELTLDDEAGADHSIADQFFPRVFHPVISFWKNLNPFGRDTADTAQIGEMDGPNIKELLILTFANAFQQNANPTNKSDVSTLDDGIKLKTVKTDANEILVNSRLPPTLVGIGDFTSTLLQSLQNIFRFPSAINSGSA